MSQVNCREAMAKLDEYLKQELTPELAAEVRQHLEHCRPCFSHARFEENFLLNDGELREKGDLSREVAGQDPGGAEVGGEGRLSPVSLPVAALTSAGVAGIAWRTGTLTGTGAVAAWTVGVLVLDGTGWAGGAVLAAFFISSNLVSRAVGRVTAGRPRSQGRAARSLAGLCQRRPRRGWPRWQRRSDPRLAIWLVTASLAAAAADTWATSIGARSRVPPRLLWSGRPVPAGTSGGVTLAGSVGALGGAAIVAGTGALFAGPLLFPVATLIGFAGMLADSLLGGVLQGRFYCSRCDQPSEWRVHRCGGATVRRAGLVWLNNDGVNFLATAFAAVLGLAAWRLLD